MTTFLVGGLHFLCMNHIGIAVLACFLPVGLDIIIAIFTMYSALQGLGHCLKEYRNTPKTYISIQIFSNPI